MDGIESSIKTNKNTGIGEGHAPIVVNENSGDTGLTNRWKY